MLVLKRSAQHGRKVQTHATRSTPHGALSPDEMAVLHMKLMGDQSSRMIKLADLYNGPFKRVRTADVARHAVDYFVSFGFATQIEKNLWILRRCPC